MNNDNYQLFLSAKELIKRRRLVEATQILKKIYVLEPYDYIIKFELAKCLLQNIKTRQDGKNMLFELLNTKNRKFAMLELGKLEVSDGNYVKARQYFESLLKSNSRDKTIAMLELGKLEVSEGNYIKARQYFERLLNTQSRTYAMLELGKLEVSEGNYVKARQYFESLLNTQSRTYAILELGKLEVSDGNYVKARQYFESLLNAQNRNFAMLELGRLEVSEGNYIKARQYFESLLNTQSRTYAMLELGKLEVSEGNYVKARQYFESLLNTQSRTYTMLELGKLEVSEGNYVKARQYFESLLKSNSRDKTIAMLELGKLEVSEGNYIKARQYFENLLNAQNRNFAMMEIIFLDIREQMYLEAYNKLKLIPSDILFSKQYFHLKFFLQYKLGMINDSQLLYNDYYIHQIFNYNEENTLDHIKKHLDENNNKIRHTIFNDNINLEELFYYAKEQIKSLNPIEISTVHKYIIECEYDISTIDGNSTNLLKVVTIPNSNNILTMYPVKKYQIELGKTRKLKK